MAIIENLSSEGRSSKLLGAAPASAKAPSHPNPAALWQIGKNVAARVSKDNLTLVAAGVAFYAMTAIFPALAAFVSIYGYLLIPMRSNSRSPGFRDFFPPIH
jgi:membrane protein